jgi:hypothetical protein
MIIRKEQMGALEADFRTRFHRRLHAMLRENLPRQTSRTDDAEMLRRIATADAKARSYGIVSERGIGQFAALGFIAGPDFDERPKVRRYLTHPGIEPHHKIDVLFDYLVERDRDSRRA